MRTAEFIERCLGLGLDLQTALKAAKAFDAELEIALEEKLDIRRAKDRARQAKCRANKEAKSEPVTEHNVNHVMSRDETLDHVNSVTERDLAGERARVRDISPKLVIPGYLTTPDDADEADLDWPESDKPSRAYLDKLEAALRDACGPALASEAVAPRVRVLAPILALGKPGRGPPCELQADVLPTIRARSARAPPGSVKSWDFFRDAITEARDRRLAGAPAQEPIHERANHRSAQPTTTSRAALRGVWAEVLAEEGCAGSGFSDGA